MLSCSLLVSIVRHLMLSNDLQIRDFRTDWELQVNQPVAGNYYPVCLFCLTH